MRIFVLALGTRGDFEPFWSLGQVLRRRGHQVTIGTSGFHIQRDPELAWVRIGEGSHAELVEVLRSLAGVPLRADRANAFVEGWVAPQLRAGKEATIAVAAQHDYFISNLKLPMRRNGAVYPGVFVSYDPPCDLEDLIRPGSHLHQNRTLELVAMPQALVDPERRWGPQFQFTGFWQRPAWSAPPAPALQAFVEASPAPIVMTMGSMVTFAAARLARCFGEALALCGRRGVLVGGWSALPAGPQEGGQLLVVDEADYAWLFARAAAVIHHGGAGTVAAVLRAGVPSILLPQIASQDSWGRLLTAANLCAGVLDTASLQAPQLAQAIQRALDDAAMRRSAVDWAPRVAADPGVERAADLIEAHWSSL